MAAIQGSPASAIQAGGANQTGITLKPDAYYDRLLLSMLRQMEFKYSKYAVEKTLPRNFGDTINWRRFNKLSKTSIVALTEGETPAGLSVSGSSVTASIAQYGDVLYFTDLVELQQLDRVKQEYTIELGHLAQEVLDTIVRDVLVAEGSSAFGHGSAEAVTANSALSTLATGDIPRIDDFRKIVLGMKKSFIKGNRKAGGRYVALVDPSIMAKLFDDNKVQNFMDFGKSNAMFGSGMVVDMFGIHFEEVLNAPYSSATSGSVVAYDSIVIGDEAYAITKLEGSGIRVISKGLGSGGVEDPLDQRQSIGYKINGFSAKVLNAEAVVNYWSVPEFEADVYSTNTVPTAWGGKGVVPAEIVDGSQFIITFQAHGDDADALSLLLSTRVIVDSGDTYAVALRKAGLSLATSAVELATTSTATNEDITLSDEITAHQTVFLHEGTIS
jgi:N4-gp56 family major capsid protein